LVDCELKRDNLFSAYQMLKDAEQQGTCDCVSLLMNHNDGNSENDNNVRIICSRLNESTNHLLLVQFDVQLNLAYVEIKLCRFVEASVRLEKLSKVRK
jgi:hypothetical protein